MEKIESWSKDFNLSPVYWLNGFAGTGKSTIAQTIAERVFADGRLGTSFFCSYDFKDSKNLHYIFPLSPSNSPRNTPNVDQSWSLSSNQTRTLYMIHSTTRWRC